MAEGDEARALHPATPSRRDELAAAAYELIAEKGLAKFTLRALARRVGATTGLVSHHFADRADLVDAAVQHAEELVRARAAAGADYGPEELLRHGLPIDDESIAHWRVWLSVRTEAMFDPSLKPIHDRMYESWQSAARVALGRLDLPDPEWAIAQVVAVLDGIALRATVDPDAWPPELQLEHARAGLATLLERTAKTTKTTRKRTTT
jgi:AcrR family transcriptional regulator